MSAEREKQPARIGRYEVLGRLGRGGMAELFLARAVGPGGVAKRLCVKRMLAEALNEPRAVERFSAEARTVLELQHANIVPVFDFGRDGQSLFLAMEWIDGCDLATLLAHLAGSGGRVPAAVAAHVTLEVARALAYAHGRRDRSGLPAGILHRDVTPSNILLSRQGEVRLTDFGIAQAVGTDATPAGTPAYMAPEAARGEAVDGRSDLYSLGLVLGEMLTGGRLRITNRLADASRPVDLPALTAAPAPLVEVAHRLLAPDRADRFASAGEVVTALAAPTALELLRGAGPPAETLARLVVGAAAAPDLNAGDPPVTSAPLTVPGPVAPRRPRLALLLGSAALLVAAGAALALRRSPPAAIRRSEWRPPGAIATTPPVPDSPARPPTTEPAAAPEAKAVHRRAERSWPPSHLKILTPASWVTVYLDGRRIGDNEDVLEIAPGRHALRVENPPLGFAQSETIEVRPGETLERAYSTRR
jgi:serine/threonine protein kinase